MLFSQRKGLKTIKSIIQTESMDQDLRNGLWNCLIIYYWQHIDDYNYNSRYTTQDLIKKLWVNYFKSTIDSIPYNWSHILPGLRKYFFGCKWFEVYDFIEFISTEYDQADVNNDFMDSCNIVLERELSAYRFVGGKITQLTSEEEISAIEEALTKSEALKPIHIHLKTALDFMSDRKSPDYRNSIKESISAVETISRLITNNSKATLGQALKKLEENKVKIHPALKRSFDSMYGYTNDADGIRHSLLEESDLKFIDAKFMLVACSSFINYLLEKTTDASIVLK
jgi:hypothetical protein